MIDGGDGAGTANLAREHARHVLIGGLRGVASCSTAA
jgi:hypothetical protein